VKNFLSASVVIAIVIFSFPALLRAETPAPSRPTNGTLEIMAKLDQVIKGQQEILNQLAKLKEEVEIVKIRATR